MRSGLPVHVGISLLIVVALVSSSACTTARSITAPADVHVGEATIQRDKAPPSQDGCHPSADAAVPGEVAIGDPMASGGHLDPAWTADASWETRTDLVERIPEIGRDASTQRESIAWSPQACTNGQPTPNGLPSTNGQPTPIVCATVDLIGSDPGSGMALLASDGAIWRITVLPGRTRVGVSRQSKSAAGVHSTRPVVQSASARTERLQDSTVSISVGDTGIAVAVSNGSSDLAPTHLDVPSPATAGRLEVLRMGLVAIRHGAFANIRRGSGPC